LEEKNNSLSEFQEKELLKKDFMGKVRDLYEQSICHLEELIDQTIVKNDPWQLQRVQDDILSYVEWCVKKTELRYFKEQQTSFPLIRFGLYWTYLGWNVGSEYNKRRPVIIISAVPGSPICTVIPVSTQRKNDGRWYHLDLEDRQNTAMCEHLKVISKARIDKPLHLTSQMPRRGDKKQRIATLTENDIKKLSSVMKRLYGSISP
jgi:mRNA-degrading endonuclease toxin of MazEF toxin-antitoxin module